MYHSIRFTFNSNYHKNVSYRYIKEYFRVSNLPVIHKEILKNKDLLNYLEEHTGLNMTNNPLLQTYKLHHFLMSQV